MSCSIPSAATSSTSRCDVSRRLGRCCRSASPRGRIPEIPANILLVKNLTVIGLYWGFYMAWGKSKADAALREKVRILFDELFELYETGKIRAPVDRALPLENFADALSSVEGRDVIGKIVLLPERGD